MFVKPILDYLSSYPHSSVCHLCFSDGCTPSVNFQNSEMGVWVHLVQLYSYFWGKRLANFFTWPQPKAVLQLFCLGSVFLPKIKFYIQVNWVQPLPDTIYTFYLKTIFWPCQVQKLCSLCWHLVSPHVHR